jgi:hypothetical protein
MFVKTHLTVDCTFGGGMVCCSCRQRHPAQKPSSVGHEPNPLGSGRGRTQTTNPWGPTKKGPKPKPQPHRVQTQT